MTRITEPAIEVFASKLSERQVHPYLYVPDVQTSPRAGWVYL